MKAPDDIGLPKLDWIVVGGESGKGSRPMHPAWIRALRNQCQTAATPMFFKSWGDYKNYQFVCDGIVYPFCDSKKSGKVSKACHGLPLKHNVLFLLNIHRERFVSINDLIDFVYDDQNPDNWPDYQKDIISIMICRIRKILPEGVKIICQYNFGYKLQIGECTSP